MSKGQLVNFSNQRSLESYTIGTYMYVAGVLFFRWHISGIKHQQEYCFLSFFLFFFVEALALALWSNALPVSLLFILLRSSYITIVTCIPTVK